jgi:hypothetical protein
MELIKANPMPTKRKLKRIIEKQEPDFIKAYNLLNEINDSLIVAFKNASTMSSLRVSLRTHAKIKQTPDRKYKFRDNENDTFTIYRIA